MNQPEFLYHYTSLETLALILENKTIAFNHLLNVDDMDEADAADLKNFGKYFYVSCWTDEARESIEMWKMYTPDMRGVRIRLPIFPFQVFHFPKGQFGIKEDITTFIDLEQVYRDNVGSIVADGLRLVPITYTEDDSMLYPTVRSGNTIEEMQAIINHTSEQKSASISYDITSMAHCKRTCWQFQKEWRYIIFISPIGFDEMKNATLETSLIASRRLEDASWMPPYPRFYLHLSDEALRQVEIVFGPRMTEGEKILAKTLLKSFGLQDNWRDSTLRIR